MNDAANSIATSSRLCVLRPQYAVVWAAFFNFIAFLVFGLHVAETVGAGSCKPISSIERVIFGALDRRHHLAICHLIGSAFRRRVRMH